MRLDLHSRWLALLAGGLVLEFCLLAAAAAIWMAANGQGLGPRSLGQTPSAVALRSANATPAPPPSATSRPAPPSPTLTASASPTPSASPTLTDTPAPDWSGDRPSGLIAFTCYDGKFDQICLMNADGSDQRQLTHDDWEHLYPSIGPDGETIVFSGRSSGSFEIYTINTSGGSLERLTHGLGNLYAPEISPKANRIVFTQESGKTQTIWVMKLDGGNPHNLSGPDGNDTDPAFSPDASRIAFISTRGGGLQLYLMNADGSEVQPVLREGSGLRIGGRCSWSPDYRYLAFFAGPQGDRDIYLADLVEKTALQLTQGGDNLSPSFSPDGAWIAFTSARDGNNEIYVMRSDGSDVHRLTYTSRADWQPRWGP